MIETLYEKMQVEKRTPRTVGKRLKVTHLLTTSIALIGCSSSEVHSSSEIQRLKPQHEQIKNRYDSSHSYLKQNPNFSRYNVHDKDKYRRVELDPPHLPPEFDNLSSFLSLPRTQSFYDDFLSNEEVDDSAENENVSYELSSNYDGTESTYTLPRKFMCNFVVFPSHTKKFF